MLLRSSWMALAGLKRTPRRARGISAGMMRALKIKADNIALAGLDRFITLSADIEGIAAANRAGKMAKYLDTSLASEKVVSAPRVMSCCLPISTISSSLAGSECRRSGERRVGKGGVRTCRARGETK